MLSEERTMADMFLTLHLLCLKHGLNAEDFLELLVSKLEYDFEMSDELKEEFPYEQLFQDLRQWFYYGKLPQF